MKKFVIVLSALVLMLLVVSGCDALQFNALNTATETPTRKVRPTFTPRASATPIPEETDTPEVTDTPAPADATDTPEAAAAATATTKPTAKPKAPAQPTAKPQPPQPPQPTFAVHPDFGAPYFCAQEGVYEVSLYIKKDGKAGKRPFAGGLWVGAFTSSGEVLKDGAGKPLVTQTWPEMSISYGSNCQREYDRTSPDATNGKLDVGDAVRAGTKNMILRFVRSQSDYTPISADVPLDFTRSGRWWMYFGYAGG